MDVFDHWRLQRELSTMQKLMDENARLRRQRELHDAVALGTWIIAALIACVLLFIKITEVDGWNVLFTLMR